jgi:glycosyltransferase involved in cell wall biosynthesis/2-polyprenyl-3-methyl-5-hydroxy-6-metoxy-1,4-benzoquinol methylase
VPALPLQGMLLPPSRQRARFGFATPESAPFAINVICMNGDTIPLFAREAGEAFFAGRHSIALWFWELGELPDEWREGFDHVDEVWVATEHMYRAVSASSPVPVVKVPLPVTLPPVPALSREELGLPEGFLFLFVYDYHSTAARKNPAGAIEAFARAFPPGSGASLVLKSINHENQRPSHERVLLAAAEHPDVHVVDRYVTAGEKNAMLAACDCYVSLHRSEGFGLTPAEAMYLGKPVIATRYGGVLDFMTADNSFLVDHGMTRVGEAAYPYPPDALWAEPDLEHAAALMRRVVAHPDEARRVGARAARDIRATHSPAVAGEAMKRRLQAVYEDLEARRRAASAPGLPAHLEGVRREIDREPAPRAAGRLAPARRLAGRAVSRLTAPQTHHARRVHEALLEGLATAQAGLGVRQAEVMAEARRLDDLEARLREQQDLLAHHLAEHRTPPYMADEHALELFEQGGAGRVLGFRRPLAAAAGERYRAFEDVFRGSEARVRGLDRAYVDVLRGHAPVLDAGCGRGELLDVLRDAGIEAHGADADEAMVAACRSKGHRVEHGDVNEVLAARDEASLGAVIATQVIEHLPYSALMRFLELALARLRPGGLLVVETVNPHCLFAFKGFWIDPTHEHPLFPEVVLTLCRIVGFESGYCFHPTGTGDVEADRERQPAYAVVARRA